MKINIIISTSKETSYVDSKTVYLNKNDEKQVEQTINLTLSGFNYRGSLKPIASIIIDWLNGKIVEGNKGLIK